MLCTRVPACTVEGTYRPLPALGNIMQLSGAYDLYRSLYIGQRSDACLMQSMHGPETTMYMHKL